ncbi:MAG: hypothetical protein Q8P18_09315 [Pseudomonadota bacterium]|nr:hypothetical protein [Pseudomonadota bacterium]
MRRVLLVGLAAGPAAWLVLPGVLSTTAIAGAPTAGIYPLLHRWWAVGGGAPPRFPEPGAALPTDALAWLLHPLVVVLGAAIVVKCVMLAGAILTVALAWRYARRITGDDFAASAAAAVFAASPAVVAGLTGGELDASGGWALVALPLVSGPAAIGVGLAVALAAPTMVPAALLPAALAVAIGAGRAIEKAPGAWRWWPLVGWAVALVAATVMGWPEARGGAGAGAWFVQLAPAFEPERVSEVYVGFGAAALIALALVLGRGFGRVWGGVGLAALALALVPSPVPERFLHLVPFAAVLGGLSVVRARAPGWAPAAAVWIATLLLAEGWRGVAAAVPLVLAPLSDPAPVTELAEGPVLDLPATHRAARRGLWYQTRHGQPIAADVAGHATAEVAALSATLSTGGCADVASVGFHTVVARREGALREMAPLLACLGKPSWDDGVVAVWRLP